MFLYRRSPKKPLSRLKQPRGLHREIGEDASGAGVAEREQAFVPAAPLHLFLLLNELRRAFSEADSRG